MMRYLKAAWSAFFDAETRTFTLSFLRDLWKAGLLVLGLRFIAFMFDFSRIPAEEAAVLKKVDFFATVAAFSVIGFVFIFKMVVASVRHD